MPQHQFRHRHVLSFEKNIFQNETEHFVAHPIQRTVKLRKITDNRSLLEHAKSSCMSLLVQKDNRSSFNRPEPWKRWAGQSWGTILTMWLFFVNVLVMVLVVRQVCGKLCPFCVFRTRPWLTKWLRVFPLTKHKIQLSRRVLFSKQLIVQTTSGTSLMDSATSWVKRQRSGGTREEPAGISPRISCPSRTRLKWTSSSPLWDVPFLLAQLFKWNFWNTLNLFSLFHYF